MPVLIPRRSAPSTPPKEDQAVSDRQRDLLRVHSRKAASVLILLAIGVFATSFAEGARTGLPTVALDWLLGLQALRAAVVFAIVSVVFMVIVRGWGGIWPRRITTTGLEFAAAEREITEGSAEVLHTLRELAQELEAKDRRSIEHGR